MRSWLVPGIYLFACPVEIPVLDPVLDPCFSNNFTSRCNSRSTDLNRVRYISRPSDWRNWHAKQHQNIIVLQQPQFQGQKVCLTYLTFTTWGFAIDLSLAANSPLPSRYIATREGSALSHSERKFYISEHRWTVLSHPLHQVPLLLRLSTQGQIQARMLTAWSLSPPVLLV